MTAIPPRSRLRPGITPGEADDAPRAIVIGAGLGGLAAAIRLAARGIRVTVLERCEQPGGRASVAQRDGFTFDLGPTIITAPFLLEDLWAQAGARLEDDVTLVSLDPFYRIRFDDGTSLDCSGDPEVMAARIEAFAPGESAGYRGLLAAAREIYRIGFEELGDVPFSTPLDMLRIAPDLVRHEGWRSVYGLVAKHFRDEKLRAAFSFHPLLIGGDPFRVSAVYALILELERRHGVHFAMGGTGRIVAGMAKLIRRLGGTIRCNTSVDRILVENGAACGVALEDGTMLRADLVVSNADAAFTYRHLLRDVRRRRWTDRKLDRARYSMGLFVWYFGTDRRYDDVPHHTIALGPRYRGLVEDIFRGGRLAPDMSLYLHRPTATDPSLAPEGGDTFYALAPVPHLGAGIDWDAESEAYRAAIQQRLEAILLPDLGRHVVTSFVLTPRDFEKRYASVLGAGFGLEPLLAQSAWFRPHNVSEEVRNLYLVGAGTHPGAGVPGVLSTARVLDRVVPELRMRIGADG